MHTPWWKRIADALSRYRRDLYRWFRFWWQRRTRGWDDRETWNLDATIARWALPRLRRFRELPHGYWHPVDALGEQAERESVAETERVLAEIQWFLEIHASEDGTWQLLEKPELRERYDSAGALFGENFGHLWS